MTAWGDLDLSRCALYSVPVIGAMTHFSIELLDVLESL